MRSFVCFGCVCVCCFHVPRLKLQPPSEYAILAQSSCFTLRSKRDDLEFEVTDRALHVRHHNVLLLSSSDCDPAHVCFCCPFPQMMNFSSDSRTGIYRILSGLLHLGNVTVRWICPAPFPSVVGRD